jgi:hypothetical protein
MLPLPLSAAQSSRFTGDPFLVDPAKAFTHEPDGLIVCRNGMIEAVGPYGSVRARLSVSMSGSPTIQAAFCRPASSTTMCIMCRSR